MADMHTLHLDEDEVYNLLVMLTNFIQKCHENRLTNTRSVYEDMRDKIENQTRTSNKSA